MRQGPATFAFAGGLDTNSAALAMPPGAVMSGMNYEPLAEGYGRIQGYERYDGRIAPSAARHWTLGFDAGAQAINAGDTVTGVTSGASGLVLLAPYALTGSWATGDAAGTLVLGNVTGTFVDNEILQVAASNSAIANGTALEDDAPTDALRRTWAREAMSWQRSAVGKVPGEGPVRGVAVHNGEVFAWRDNVGATALRCYRATASGWQALSTLRKLPFTAGTAAIADGATIVGATSGASAIVKQTTLVTGSYAAGDAAGFLDILPVTGTFQVEALQVSAATVAQGEATTGHTLAPGGRVRGISHNFYGASDLYRFYGATGAAKGFELLPDGMATIDTGMTDDRPQRVFEIGNHLGFTFPGGSIQFSGTGEPRIWEVIVGAGEIGFGSDLTDVVQANETAVAFFGESKIGILQGQDQANFVLDILTEEAGAEPDTAQRIARTVYLDRRGLRSLDATQAFGNFKTGTLSGQFERYFRIKRKAGATALGSYVSKSKSHYRLMWNDGTGLAIYMGGKKPEAIPFSTGDMRPFCFGGGELADDEGIFCGGEDGYVYRLDSGNSFDGDQIRGFVMTPFNHFGAPEAKDRFLKVIAELDAPATANIGLTVQYDYGDGQQPISGEQDFTAMGGANDVLVAGGGGVWDSAFWNQFYWSSPVESRAEWYIDGIGRNASFIFATTAEVDEDPHVLQAYVVHRSRRGAVR